MNAFERTFDHLDHLMKENEIKEPAYLNMVVTNGLFVVATRFVTEPRETPLTLYHSIASQYAVENGVGQIMPAAGDDKSVLIVSEKLSKDWIIVRPNHFVVVDNDLHITTRPIKSCANN
jgi:hypothetical protein